jgi:hypothetical protein
LIWFGEDALIEAKEWTTVESEESVKNALVQNRLNGEFWWRLMSKNALRRSRIQS